MVETKKETTEAILTTILELSRCISYYSPAIKPFVRFSKKSNSSLRNRTRKEYSDIFWDFDYLLQQLLLNLAYKVVSPDEIVKACIEQWKRNLEGLYKNMRCNLELSIANKTRFRCGFAVRKRSEFMLERIKPGSRLLYVGCGSGRSSFFLAEQGVHVVGIDTNNLLTDLANEWSDYLKVPFKAIYMDVMDLKFERNSFDSFLLECYGSWPSLNQTIYVQRILARILKDEGEGFIMAIRRKYTSYWYKMGYPYPEQAAKWLAPQADLDLKFSEPDACIGSFVYGLYIKSHTTQSLSSELSHTFDVLQCKYEAYDPRYILAVVKRKKGTALSVPAYNQKSKKKISEHDILSVGKTISKVEAICDMLISHSNRLGAFFLNANDTCSIRNPLVSVKTDTAKFMSLLEDVLKEP